MTLSSMVVSRDWQEVSVLECILGSLHMDVAVEQEPQRALTRLNKSKIDAVIVDCDLDGSEQLLRHLQENDPRIMPVPLVIMGGNRSRQTIDTTGALYSFAKPISVEQAVRTLSAARNMILDGRLRYHRAGLNVPVSLSFADRSQVEADLVNVSQGGLRVHTDSPLEEAKNLHLSFELPGTKSVLKAEARIAWQDKRGNAGIHFVKLTSSMQRTLQLWLAQKYFAN